MVHFRVEVQNNTGFACGLRPVEESINPARPQESTGTSLVGWTWLDVFIACDVVET